MNMFRNLSEQEAAEFKACARATYKPLSEIKGIWHPVVQAECVRMNCEATQITPPEMQVNGELLAALEEFVSAVEVTGGLDEQSNPVAHPGWFDLGQAFIRARAAIAKAKGQP